MPYTPKTPETYIIVVQQQEVEGYTYTPLCDANSETALVFNNRKEAKRYWEKTSAKLRHKGIIVEVTGDNIIYC
jgi:hypothetical protein